jgi:hypothetical protein
LIVRIDAEGVDVWENATGKAMFECDLEHMPDWASNIQNMAALTDRGLPIWAITDYEYNLRRFLDDSQHV